MSSDAIRPELPDTKRRPIEIGQVWTVDDQTGCRWFVLSSHRIIALFAGGADHTPRTLVHTYGDQLRLEQIATVYADNERAGRHAYRHSEQRNEDYINLCARCGLTPMVVEHQDVPTATGSPSSTSLPIGAP